MSPAEEEGLFGKEELWDRLEGLFGKDYYTETTRGLEDGYTRMMSYRDKGRICMFSHGNNEDTYIIDWLSNLGRSDLNSLHPEVRVCGIDMLSIIFRSSFDT
jgi:hypothetical protein